MKPNSGEKKLSWVREWLTIIDESIIPSSIEDLQKGRVVTFVRGFVPSLFYEPLILDVCKVIIERSGIGAEIKIRSHLINIIPKVK